jgi:hypothetical protein
MGGDRPVAVAKGLTPAQRIRGHRRKPVRICQLSAENSRTRDAQDRKKGHGQTPRGFFADHQAHYLEGKCIELYLKSLLIKSGAVISENGKMVRKLQTDKLIPLCWGEDRLRPVTMAIDAGDDGAQRRQVDVVVGMDLRQVGRADCLGAVRTGSKCRLDDPVRVFGQSSGDARTAATGLLRTVGKVRLLTFRGRDARVVRRLCWSREPGFQFRNTCRQDAALLSLRLNLRVLCLDQGDQVIVRKGE